MKKTEVAGNAVYSVAKIVVIILAVMFIYRLGTMAYSYGERLFGEPPMTTGPGIDIVITIDASDTVKDVAEKVVDAGLARDVTLFTIQETLLGTKQGIQPGTYTLNTSQTPEEIIQAMSALPAGEEDAQE